MEKITKINLAGRTFEVQDERVTESLLPTIEQISANTQKLMFIQDITIADNFSVLMPSAIYNVNGSALLILTNSGTSVGAMHQTLLQNGKILYRYNIKEATTTMDASYWSEWQESGAKTIEWTEESNMNNYKVSGIYVCENGIRTNTADNLPIANSGSAHNFSFVLQVAASNSIENPAVGQTLYLTNRYGSETKQYIRTYLADGWTGWREVTGTLTLGNSGMVDERTLNSTTEWGEYNGVLFDPNWMKAQNIVLANLVNAITAYSGAATIDSGEIRKALDHLYDIGSGDQQGAFRSNLFGCLFKMRVYDNSSVLNGINAYFGEVAGRLTPYVGRRIVQELDVIPFTIISPEWAPYWGYGPRTIKRIGMYKDDGTIQWGKFIEADGSESILQIEMTRFTYR